MIVCSLILFRTSSFFTGLRSDWKGFERSGDFSLVGTSDFDIILFVPCRGESFRYRLVRANVSVDRYCYADWGWKVYLIQVFERDSRYGQKKDRRDRKKHGNGKVADWVVEEASMEKMGAMMCDNSNKLIGIYDELTHFLTQINIYRNRGLSDTHDLAMFLQLYNGLPWSRRTGTITNCHFCRYLRGL